MLFRQTWTLYKNKFKIVAPRWNENFELPNGLYSISYIQHYFDIIKKNETITDNPPIKIYVNKIENGITLIIKKGYYFELLTLEMIKLLEALKVR